MKICLLGDTHFGIRNDSKVFHSYYEKFYRDTLFPYLDKHSIDTVIQLGDLFDRRKYINFVSLFESRRYFFDSMVEKGIKLHALIGNHDIFWKHSLAVNSPDLLLKGYDNITLYDKPTKITLGGADIDMIPWICDENMEEVQRFIRASVSPTCIGHFELSGFQLMKGVQAFEGTSADFLDRYDAVFSGHYHTQSESGNVRYLGVPYEMFWSDYKDPKGFFVFDTETYSMEFVPNPHIIFHKIFYDDTQPDFNVDAEMYKDCYVKVVVLNRKNPHTFDKMIDALYEVGLVDLTIVEDHAEILDESALPEVLDQAEDTLTILSSYITQQQVDVDVNRLNALMRELYMDAMSRETLT